MQTNINREPDFIATLRYRTTEEGGRRTAAKSGYRPTIKFNFDKMLTSGIQTFIDKDIVNPGDIVRAEINILSAPHFAGRLSEGMEFIFTEGSRIIGTGIINGIINPRPKYLKTNKTA